MSSLLNRPSLVKTPSLLKNELRVVTLLASIFSLRMLGLFMILPVFAIAAQGLPGASPKTIGIAIGIYGLMQALLQAPLGYISDRLGRKPVIAFGLFLLSLGSVVAALSHTMIGVILGRCLQGSGAVGGVTLALLSDSTREEVRLRAMAVIGISIGAAFGFAFILGPLCAQYFGLSGIFWVIAVLSLVAIFVLLKGAPDSNALGISKSEAASNNIEVSKSFSEADAFTTQGFRKSWSSLDRKLYLPFCGIFILHACLAAIFLELPLALKNFIPAHKQALSFYLPVFFTSALSTFPIIKRLEKKQHSPKVFLLPLILFLISIFIMMFIFHSLPALTLGLYLFFTAFNVLEASLPSYISKLAPSQQKGLALGVFSSLQFLGLCLGGILGGYLDEHLGFLAVFIFCVILALVWFTWVLFSKEEVRSLWQEV